MQIIQAAGNSKIQIGVIPGHYATNHSHINYYVDITSLKTGYKMAKEAAKFKSIVTVESGAKKGDAKKIMSLMMLGAKKEHTLSFTVEGEDEEACAAALEAFLKENL